MKSIIASDVRTVLEAPHSVPSVSILLPVVRSSGRIQLLQHQLKSILNKTEAGLRLNYPSEIVATVMHRMKSATENLQPASDVNGLAVFASPVFEKVVPLQIPVTEQVHVGASFQIRDVIKNAKRRDRFLLLILSATHSRLLIGEGGELNEVPNILPSSINEVLWDIPNRMKEYADPAEKKEIVLHKYLHAIDNELHKAVVRMNLPVIVMGVDRVLGHFQDCTTLKTSIIASIPGNFISASNDDLQEKLQPYLYILEQNHQHHLMEHIEKAVNASRIVCGIHEVWRYLQQQPGSLLLVEEGFRFPGELSSENMTFPNMVPATPGGSADAVDDVMEKVLAQGSDVEIVPDGMLKQQGRIALITYF